METIKVVFLGTLLMVLSTAPAKALTREKRAWIIDSFSIEEEHPGPYPFILGQVKVEHNYRLRFKVTGSGVDKEPVGVLSIDKDTGNITVHRKVDYELFPVLKLTFEAINTSSEMIDARLGVEINILDINDNEPRFQRQVYNATVEESMQQGQLVLIVEATDYDKKGSPNSAIDYRIVSVEPETPNVQFYIENSGRISFKGCLDYEKAKMYTMVVEAKDRGEVQRQSSSCTVIVNVEDRNNHRPVFAGHRAMFKGLWRVKERVAGKPVLRLQVTDKDSRKTAAWRARYKLHGEDSDSFHIDTDPETNEGILSVIKPLDYEKGPWRNLSVSAENEIPFFSCEVTGQPPQGLWTVRYVSNSSEKEAQSRMKRIAIAVEDVNDPPEFPISIKNVTVDENRESGLLLVKFTPKDEDVRFAGDLVCRKSKDPAGWIDVDPRTCEIYTAKVYDRESPFVVNGTYTVTIIAVDNGQPPMTGTATLNIHLRDQNDNTPQLAATELDMCLTEGESRVNITAFDLDGHPYAGPFIFELLNDAKGPWMVQPSFGTTVSLVTKTAVYTGHHSLRLKISDMQGLSSQWNIFVTVCYCSSEPSCHASRVSASRTGVGTVGVILGILLLLMGLLLLAIFLSYEKRKEHLQVEQGSEDFLLQSNTEAPGTDCQVPDVHQVALKRQEEAFQAPYTPWIAMGYGAQQEASDYQGFSGSRKEQVYQEQNGHQAYEGVMRSSSPREHSQGSMRFHSWRDHYQVSGEQTSAWSETCSSMRNYGLLGSNKLLLSVLSQRIHSIEESGKELEDYDPHVYADEGSPPTDPALEAISISGDGFDSDALLDLDPKFSSLAAVCMLEPQLLTDSATP